VGSSRNKAQRNSLEGPLEGVALSSQTPPLLGHYPTFLKNRFFQLKKFLYPPDIMEQKKYDKWAFWKTKPLLLPLAF